MRANANTSKEPLFRISKRNCTNKWGALGVRAIAILLALIACGIMSEIFESGSFGFFYKNLFLGVFGTPRRILLFFQNTALMLLIALAVTPAFKMRFWNIGAEGQTLMGAFGAAIIVFYLGKEVNNSVLLILMLVVSIAFGCVWAVIPALFKAKWNTNETLFTLMMNYIAIQLVLYTISQWVPSGSGALGTFKTGRFPNIFGKKYILNIIIVAIVTVIMFIYLRYTKHGYEISVIGGSEKTAKYIGINVKKTIIRTLMLSGALCGLAGYLLVAGTSHTVSSTIVDGRGFTAILVSWLARFNPIYMVGTSMLVIFFDQGASEVATEAGFGGEFADMVTGLFFIIIIASEFFINYEIKFRTFKKNKTEVNAQ